MHYLRQGGEWDCTFEPGKREISTTRKWQNGLGKADSPLRLSESGKGTRPESVRPPQKMRRGADPLRKNGTCQPMRNAGVRLNILLAFAHFRDANDRYCKDISKVENYSITLRAEKMGETQADWDTPEKGSP